MSILITGGAGFISSFLIRSLLKRDEKIVVYDINIDRCPLREILSSEEIARLTLVKGDVADPIGVYRTITEHQADRVLHMSMIASPQGDANPYEGVRTHVMGALAVFEAARALRLKRVIWAGSAQAFGRHEPYSHEFGLGPLTDTSPHRPYSIYSASKTMLEYLGSHYHRKFALDLRGLRPCGTFGPGRMPGLTSHISEMLRKVALGEPYTMADGDHALPHCYVEDSARAFEVALYHEGDELSGRTLNIGGHSTTNREMVDLTLKVLPEAQITVLPGDGGQKITLPIDNSNLNRITGYQLRYSLEDGVRATIDFYRRRIVKA